MNILSKSLLDNCSNVSSGVQPLEHFARNTSLFWRKLASSSEKGHTGCLLRDRAQDQGQGKSGTDIKQRSLRMFAMGQARPEGIWYRCQIAKHKEPTTIHLITGTDHSRRRAAIHAGVDEWHHQPLCGERPATLSLQNVPELFLDLSRDDLWP